LISSPSPTAALRDSFMLNAKFKHGIGSVLAASIWKVREASFPWREESVNQRESTVEKKSGIGTEDDD